MRRPRDLIRYVSAERAAAQLRAIADSLANSGEAYPRIRWDLHLRYWNPKWASPDGDRGIITSERLGQ